MADHLRPRRPVRRHVLSLPQASGSWLSGPTTAETVIGLGRFSRFLAIQRQGEHWCGPVWGTRACDIPAGTVCLLLERPGSMDRVRR